jgi:hypothetical protein
MTQWCSGSVVECLPLIILCIYKMSSLPVFPHSIYIIFSCSNYFFHINIAQTPHQLLVFSSSVCISLRCLETMFEHSVYDVLGINKLVRMS